MMESDRGKPRVTHVRTGCLTCKRRRVKCPEERPSCSRCTRAGFVCAGYAVPKAWLFEGSGGSQARGTDVEPRPDPAEDVQPPAHTSDHPTSAASPGYATHLAIATATIAPTGSSVQPGNLAPFDTYAIPIGPRESYLIEFYRSEILPEMYNFARAPWMRVMAAEDWTHSMNCLKDEAAAYSMLARISVLESLMVRGPGAPTSTSLLDYMAKAQASLYKRLPLIDGSETPSTVYSIMWATGYLAGTEMTLGSSTSDVHIRALCNLLVRYVELMGSDLDEGSIVNLVFMDIARAAMAPARPMLDIAQWFPRVFGNAWEAARSLWPVGPCGPPVVHADVKDDLLRANMLELRQSVDAIAKLPGLGLNLNLDAQSARLIAVARQSRNLFRKGQLLNISMDALDILQQPDVASDQVDNYSVQAFVSLAALLWSHRVAPVMVRGNILLDTAPGILHQLKATISKHMDARAIGGHRGEPHMDARLWALYVGAQTECHRSEVLGLDKVCDEWFLETFYKQASSMRVATWQDAVLIFEQFLHIDYLVPHISQWWSQATEYEIPIR